MIPEGDPDLITYLTELLRTNKQDQQTNTFWFPTPENPGNTQEHTPIQTRILKELRELQLNEKRNPKADIESRMEFLKRFDWTDTLLTETEKQAFEDILVEFHDIFVRHRLDIEMNTEFKLRLTPKDDKAVYTDFCNILVFYSGGTLVWVCRHYCLWVVGSHCLSVARQGLPNHSALIPVPGV